MSPVSIHVGPSASLSRFCCAFSVRKAAMTSAGIGVRCGVPVSSAARNPSQMPREIQPREPAAIAELSQFLTKGFRAAHDAEFAAPDILAWKYFDDIGHGTIPRSLVAREN